MLIYNKLIRDLIPDVIAAEGKRYCISHIEGETLIFALQEKLYEEFQEFVNSSYDLEELADILEVVEALAVQLGSSFEKILELKESKKNKRGGFQKGIF